MKRMVCKLLTFIALCLLLTVPVSAAQQGSLLLTNVSEPVSVFCVADVQGVPTDDFSGLAEKLTLNDLTPDVAKKFYQCVQQKELSGKTVAANEKKEVFFSGLKEGWYLVCSMKNPGEFAPFLICVPMTIGNETVYNILAEPKQDEIVDPPPTGEPEEPKPNIPQTGAILWPQYLLLGLGAVAIVAGLIEVVHGREKKYE